MPALNPRLSVLTREEADVVPDLRDGDVGDNLRHLRVESEGLKYVAHTCDGGLGDGQNWPRGKHIDAPGGWKYE